MKKALKDYAAGPEDDELPVRDKSHLFTLLDEAMEQGLAYCQSQGVPLHEALNRDDVFTKLGQFNGFADTLLASDEQRKSFNVYENTISSLYEACKPEVLGRKLSRVVSAFQYLRGVMDSIVEQVDIDSAVQRIEALLDASVVVDKAEAFSAKEFEAQYKIVQRGKAWDLSKVNVEKLREEFQQAPFKNIQIADLQAFLQRKLAEMLAQNSRRVGFIQRLQNVIDAYNSGATSTENYYDELTAYAEELKEEAERHIREGLTEDELELFDLLNKESLTQEETQRVKLAAKHLLKRLVEEQPKVLIQNWHQSAQTQKQVRAEIERVLDADLPESYDRTTFKQKCDNVYDLAVEYALRGRKWAA
nr:type I restriction enzyme endonuclease domain-containing protein [Stenotrophomonas maltophilia]